MTNYILPLSQDSVLPAAILRVELPEASSSGKVRVLQLMTPSDAGHALRHLRELNRADSAGWIEALEDDLQYACENEDLHLWTIVDVMPEAEADDVVREAISRARKYGANAAYTSNREAVRNALARTSTHLPDSTSEYPTLLNLARKAVQDELNGRENVMTADAILQRIVRYSETQTRSEPGLLIYEDAAKLLGGREVPAEQRSTPVGVVSRWMRYWESLGVAQAPFELPDPRTPAHEPIREIVSAARHALVAGGDPAPVIPCPTPRKPSSGMSM